MIIKCNNAEISTTHDLSDFLKSIEKEEEKDFLKNMKRVNGCRDYLITEYDLYQISYKSIIFAKDNIRKQINYYLKLNDLSVRYL